MMAYYATGHFCVFGWVRVCVVCLSPVLVKGLGHVSVGAGGMALARSEISVDKI